MLTLLEVQAGLTANYDHSEWGSKVLMIDTQYLSCKKMLWLDLSCTLVIAELYPMLSDVEPYYNGTLL